MKNTKKIIFITIAVGIYMFKPVYYTYLFSYFKSIIGFINNGVEEADPNWLFATYAQSTAAIVAILGGFIVSRILSLSAQKNNIKAEIEDLDTNISTNLTEHNQEKEKVIEYFIHSDLSSRSLDNFSEKVDEINIEEFLKLKLEDDQLTTLNNFLIKNLTPEDIYFYYNKAYELIEEKDDNGSTTNKAIIFKELEINDSRREIEKRKHENVLNHLNSIRIKYNLLKNRKEKLLQKLKKFRYPKGLKTGIYVFSYFTLVGLIIPVALIPMKISDFNINIKWLTFILFSSGVVSVSGYLVWSMKKITEVDNDFINNQSK